MTTVAFDADVFLNEVMPELPSCPKAMVVNAIRNAVIEFCARSRVWQVDLAAIAAVANQAAYAFSPPAASVVAEVISAWYDALPIYPNTQSDLADLYDNWTTEAGDPKYFVQNDTASLILVPMPDASLASAITVKVALKPTRAATAVESWLSEKYLEEMAHGAKGRLLAIPKKPWSDAALSAYHTGLFEQGIASARLDAEQGFTNAPIHTRRYI